MSDMNNIIAGLYDAFNFEVVTITNNVTALTSSKYLQADGDYAKKAFITVETAQIRYKYNGDNPTSSEGHILNPMDVLILTGSKNIQNFKAIRTGSTSGKLMVTYEK